MAPNSPTSSRLVLGLKVALFKAWSFTDRLIPPLPEQAAEARKQAAVCIIVGIEPVKSTRATEEKIVSLLATARWGPFLRSCDQRVYQDDKLAHDRGGRHLLALPHIDQPVVDALQIGVEALGHESGPGQQVQVDFAEFRVAFTSEPGVLRKVWLFSMVLGHSRWLWGRFRQNQTLETVMRRDPL
ncbi:hypothetical protein GCM10011452_36390 [Gemmobacter lanyuensis]|uniref:Uncharacterized protein n=1 Tax=Gemmobacter lanyuensis TaxID=1054497 RepID=A0A918MP02_9RHOB|nr:hypothetical protein GCM10011452_36390 [Gemmobacter lanyuensis]